MNFKGFILLFCLGLVVTGTAFAQEPVAVVNAAGNTSIATDVARAEHNKGLVEKFKAYLLKKADKPESNSITLDVPTTVKWKHVAQELDYSIVGASKQFDNGWGSNDRGLRRDSVLVSKTTVGLPDVWIIKNTDISVYAGYGWFLNKNNGESYDSGAVVPLKFEPRWNFYNNEKWQLKAAVISDFIVPVGHSAEVSKGEYLTDQHFSTGNKLVVEKDFNRLITLVNIGYITPGINFEKTNLNTGVGVGYRVFEWLQPMIEFNYGGNYYEKGQGNMNLVFGLLMPIHKNVTLTAGIMQDIAGQNTDQTTSGIFKVRASI